jgi:hypothetical protein
MPFNASGRGGFILTTCAGALLLIVVLWLQAALVGITHDGWTAAPGEGGLTQAYTVALAKGQPYLDHAPDPRLLALPNPYDPTRNSGYRILDVSLYSGRYYLYFGLAPWAVLLVPWFKLTGTHLSDGAAIWIFCATGCCAYTLALFKIWRRWFASVSPLAFFLAALIPAVASGAWSLLALPQMTQVPSAAAYAFFALAWLGLVAAEAHPPNRIRWLSMAMLAAALVMGCRPNYAPAVALLVGWAGFKAWRHLPVARWRSLTFVLLPLFVVGALLAAWNYARFANPLEFGFRYQLADVNRGAGEGGMNWRHVAFNFHRYVFGGARLSDYFPFIAGESPGPFALPAGREASDQVYGFTWLFPVLFIGALTLLGRVHRTLRDLAILTSVCSLGNLLLLSAFGGGAYRYPVDFVPPLALSAGSAVFIIAQWTPLWTRLLAVVFTCGLLLWSAAASLCQTVSLYDRFIERHSQAFAALACPFNAVVYLGERLLGESPHALRLTLRFPQNRSGLVEPLVVLGAPSLQDFLYVYYAAPDKIQFGFESIGRGGPVSRQVTLDFNRPHTLELRYGSFLPPDDHPLLRALSSADRDLARRMLTVLLDGEIVLDGWADFHAPKGVTRIGTSPENAAFGPRFTGAITGTEYPPMPALGSPVRWQSAHYGPLRLNITLRSAPVTEREPLLNLGHRNQGALIVLERLPEARVRLGYFPTGAAEIWSLPFVWPQDQAQTLSFELGALLPPASASLWPASTGTAQRNAAKSRLDIRLGEQTVFSAETPPLDVSPATVILARNDLLIAGVAPTLAADIAAPVRLPWAGLTTPVAPDAQSSESVRKNADHTSNRR